MRKGFVALLMLLVALVGCAGTQKTAGAGQGGGPAAITLTSLESPKDAKPGWYTVTIGYESEKPFAELATTFEGSRVSWNKETYRFSPKERPLKPLSEHALTSGGKQVYAGTLELALRTSNPGRYKQVVELRFGGAWTNKVKDSLAVSR